MIGRYKGLAGAFFRVGILGFGGGPSSIPLVHHEVVTKYKWMSDDEFADILALGNALPGPIITKMAGYIGYRVAGVTGLVIALVTSILPTVALMIGLLQLLATYKDVPFVQNMASAVVPVAAVMLAIMTFDFFKKSVLDLHWSRFVAMVIVAFVAINLLGIHPGLVIGAVMVVIFSPLLKGARK